jgi:hypothetical protein
MKTKARNEMIQNAMAHNKYLTEEFLQKKSDEELICFIHPSDRNTFERKLGLPISKELLYSNF